MIYESLVLLMHETVCLTGLCLLILLTRSKEDQINSGTIRILYTWFQGTVARNRKS